MANPKHRTSKSRRLSAPAFAECPQCHQPKLPHRICPNCGYYKNREVIKVEAE